MSWNDKVDGPALFGYGGGALGTSQQAEKGGYKEALRWNRDGNVNVAGELNIDGNVKAYKGVNVSDKWVLQDEGGVLVFRDKTNTKAGKDSRYALFPGEYVDVHQNMGGAAAAAGSGIDYNKAVDFVLGKDTAPERGPVGPARALVRDGGSALTINYAGDFAGGVNIQGPRVNLAGDLTLPSGKVINIRDQFHGMSWKDTVDGPSVYGYGGGALGTSQQADKGGYKEALKWNRGGDVSIAGNVIMDGDNSWILHTPDDGRKQLYIAPRKADKSDWDWSKQTQLMADGSIIISPSGLKVSDGNDWMRIFGSDKNGTAMYNGVSIKDNGGLNVGEWARVPEGTTKTKDLLVGNTAYFKGGASVHNPDNWQTHFPWAGDNKNYIRGDTELRGNVNNIGNLDIGGEITGKGLTDYNLYMKPSQSPNKSAGWNIDDNNNSWDPKIRGADDRKGLMYTDIEGVDTDCSARFVDYDVPAGMRTAHIFHLPWSNCGYFDVWGRVGSETEWQFVTRVNAFQNVRTEQKLGFHDGAAIVTIPQVNKYNRIRIQGRKGRIHLMGIGWLKTIASSQTNGLVHADSINGVFSNGINVASGQPVNIRDQFHGMSWKQAYDGPALYGYGGGALGTSQQAENGGYKEALRWNRDGNVNVAKDLRVENGVSLGGSGEFSIDYPNVVGGRFVVDKEGNVKTRGDIITGSNPMKFSSRWSGFPDNKNNGSEIANDVNDYKQLMIVGNKSAGAERRVGVWDRLDVHGHLQVDGNTEIAGRLLPKYTHSPYTDAGGNDITRLDGKNWWECRDKCNGDVNCKGFNFSAGAWPNGNGTCWIKNNVVNKGNTADWHLFTKNY